MYSGCSLRDLSQLAVAAMADADIRQRMDHRRREQFEKFTRALAEVNPLQFMEDAVVGACSLDLQLSGAIPPVTELRRNDAAGAAAIVLSERRAANELIAKNRQESLTTKQAVVHEARQIRSAQWKLQSVRPTSMDSTRDGSPFHMHNHSPWSDTSDGDGLSSNVTPRPGAESSLAQTERSRTAPSLPLGKAFEDMLANYYRTHEEIQDAEFAAAQKARREESEQLQREHVRREHFEMQHRKREFAIVHELHRRERRRVFDDTRAVLVTDRLAEEQRKLRFEQHLRKEAAKEQREERRARRAKYESHFDFILSQEALDRACNKADMQKHWQTQRAQTKERVEHRKDKWTKRSGQLRARRLFQQEQKRLCSREQERQHAYNAAKQRAAHEKELVQRQENVHLHHVLKTIVREIQKERKELKDGKKPVVTVVRADEPAAPGSSRENGPLSHQSNDVITSLNDEVCAVLGIEPDGGTITRQQEVRNPQP